MAEIERKGFKDKKGDKVTLKPKVANATENNFASFDSEGHLKDSRNKASDFAPATGSTAYAAAIHTHPGYAASTHNHEIRNITGLQDAISALSARVAALEAQAEGTWETIESLPVTDSNKHGSDTDKIDGLTISNYAAGDTVRIELGASGHIDVVVANTYVEPNGVAFTSSVWGTGKVVSGITITLKKRVVSSGSTDTSEVESGQGNTQGPGQQGDAEEGGGLADVVTP